MLLMPEQNKSHVGDAGSSFSSLTLPPLTGGVSGGHGGNKVIRQIFLAVSAILVDTSEVSLCDSRRGCVTVRKVSMNSDIVA